MHVGPFVLKRTADGHAQHGDLIVEVKVVLPRMLDERSKELLREFGRLNAASEVRQASGEAS